MRLTTVALVALGGLLVVAVTDSVLTRWGLERAERRAAHLALKADSIAAAADTTRRVLVDAEARLDTYQRRAVQVEAERDSLERSLDVEHRARARLEIAVEEMAALVASQAVTLHADSIRRATFDFYREPVRLRAVIDVPPPPGQATGDFRVRLDPLVIDRIAVSCGPAVGGVRPATVEAVVPAWTQARIEEVTAHPLLCNPPAPPRPPSRLVWLVWGAAAGMLAWEWVR